MYDSEGRLILQDYYRDYKYSGGTQALGVQSWYSYGTDGRLIGQSIYLSPYSLDIGYTYDRLGRTLAESYEFFDEDAENYYGYTRTYSYYAPAANHTSLRISSVTNEYTSSAIANEVFSYTYDNVGNITKIYINGALKYSYEYDNLGQLTRENNADTSRTYVYTYDDAGNIQTKKIYGYTTAIAITTTLYDTIDYTYDSVWGDKLTAYDGVTITYDEIGNPLTYYTGSASYTMTWTQGRRLATMSGNGQSLSFTYNADGIRTSKTVNGVTHFYHLAGTRILSEEWTDANNVQHLIVYHYDANGQPVGMSYRNSTYYEYSYDSFLFVKNIQGDIIKVLDNEGNLLVSYTYDAWGNSTSTTYSNSGASTAVVYNPFRYRGYYFDSETGLYYLNSRYYNPNIGRFINADELAFLGANGDMQAYNLFSYCSNNPVTGVDYTGYFNWGGFLTGVGITAVGIALIIATAGAAAPAVAAVAGVAIGAATVSTGVTMMEAAATDSVMVMDISVSMSGDGVKNGTSLVLDFGENTYDVYAHEGYTASNGGSPITYSTGIVLNYETVGDYGGPFVNAGGSCDWLGLDYCRSPDTNIDSVSAVSITFGLPGTKGVHCYVGWDNYRQITFGDLGKW